MIKSVVFFLSCMILLGACGKVYVKVPRIEGELSPTQLALMAQIWLLDSVKSNQPGDTAIVQENPKTEIVFGESSYEVQHSSTSTPNSTFRYEIEGTTILYYWPEEKGKENDKYFTIETLNDKSWVISYSNDNYRIYEYYHAR